MRSLIFGIFWGKKILLTKDLKFGRLAIKKVVTLLSKVINMGLQLVIE